MDLIRVAIADDQLLFRRGMAAIVNRFKGIKIKVEADNGQQLLDALRAMKQPPEVALLDLSMPELNGVETTRAIRQLYPAMKVIILSVHGEERFVMHLMELGVNAYLFKNAEPAEVELAIRTVMEKDFYFNESFRQAMVKRVGAKSARQLLTANLPNTLTSREVEVLVLICRQRTGAEIADELNLSTRTIEGYRASIMIKTGARNTAGLVMFAVKNSLLDVSDMV